MSTGAPLDVVVLAAGRGSRLAAVGDDRPKWLLEVAGATIASRHLAAFERFAAAHPDRLRSVTVVTGHAADALDRVPLGERPRRLHNPRYLDLNNWYSVLVALRALPDDARVVVVNGDLMADPGWVLAFLEASSATDDEALLAIDFARTLTDESMKVSGREEAPDLLDTIGKHAFPRPVGEYVGLLMATGAVLEALRKQLTAFEGDDDAAQQWYEGAVGLSAAAGQPWRLWPTPSSDWVEIDDLDDLARAQQLGS